MENLVELKQEFVSYHLLESMKERNSIVRILTDEKIVSTDRVEPSRICRMEMNCLRRRYCSYEKEIKMILF